MPIRYPQRAAALCLLTCLFGVPAQAQAFFTRFLVDTEFTGAHSLISADLDGDGDPDLLSASLVNSDIAWWENSDSARVWTEHIVATEFLGARFAGAADLDGDQDLDLYGAAAATDEVGWWENTDGTANTWTYHAISDSFDFAIDLFAGDIDGDEDIDLAGAALKGDAIVWWENNADGLGGWVEHPVDLDMNGARDVVGADMDGDLDMDLIATAKNGDIIRWWENTVGDGSEWVAETVSDAVDSPISVFPADLDGDLDMDLLVTSDISADVMWWEQAEEGWIQRNIDVSFDGAVSAVAVDLDQDDDLDVVAVGTSANTVNWWENRFGAGSIWVQHIIDPEFEQPSYVHVADLDMDGDPDIAAASLVGNIAWWKSDQVDPQLPVELVRFDAVADGAQVRLDWETASETNNAGFQLQQYTQLAGWQEIAFVAGSGTTAERHQYSYTTGPLEPGRHRFRLRQTDFDGTSSLSDVVSAVVFDGALFTMSEVYPNPFNPTARFTLSVPVHQNVRIDVYNILGQHVRSLHDGALASGYPHVFDLEGVGLSGGMYFIQVHGAFFSASKTAMMLK